MCSPPPDRGTGEDAILSAACGEAERTIRLRLGGDPFDYPWAIVALPGKTETEIVGFDREGEEYVLTLPTEATWTLTFAQDATGLTEAGLAELCPELRRIGLTGLELDRCWRLNDRFLEFLSEVESLERLILSDISGYFCRGPADPVVTRVGLGSLAKLPKLRHLMLAHFDGLSDEDWAAGIGGLRGLRALGLQSCKGIGSRAATAIGGLRELEFLCLRSAWALKDDDLRSLRSCAKLLVVDIQWCGGVTERCLDHLAAARRLHTLDLGYCGSIRGGVVEKLDRFPELRNLEIEGLTGLTEERLAVLAALSALEVLDLTGCEEVDDSTLQILARSASLRRIRIAHTSVTEVGVGAFRKRRPQCAVETKYEKFGDSQLDPVLLLR